MFNYGAIDKIPTVNQIKSIIDYMENEPDILFNFDFMMDMNRPEPNVVNIDINNAHAGKKYEVKFNDKGKIVSFKYVGAWIS